MEKLVAVLIMIFLILVAIYFFKKDKLNGSAFTAFILGLIFLFIGFYSIDRVKEFNVTGMKLVLSEMKETKSNFDSRVAILLEILSELNIDFTISRGLMSDGPDPEELVKTRALSARMLDLAGKSKQEIALQTNKIDITMLGLYASKISTDVQKKAQDKTDISELCNEQVQKFFHLTTPKAEDIDDFAEVLKSKDIEEALYKEYIADMHYYLKEKKLRRPFSPNY